MALKRNGDLQKVSLILTKTQVAKMRALHEANASDARRVTLADVGREVVEQGLARILSGTNSSFGVITETNITERLAS